MIERRQPTPLELELEASLEDNHVASLEVSPDDLVSVVQLLSQQLLEKNGASKISFKKVAVEIKNQSAEISIVVSIALPVSATFTISYALSNSYSQLGTLSVTNLKVGIEASRLAKLSLKVLQVEKQIKDTLANLNEVLALNPPPLVTERGLAFTKIHIHLENTHLAVQLRSTSVST